MKKRGRPLKYTNTQLQQRVDKYFEDCDNNNIKKIYNSQGVCIEEVSEPYTISGLALALDTNRETLNEWMKNESKGFSDIIKKAHLKIIKSAEINLIIGKSVAGEIFRLKNMDPSNWKDKTEIDAKNDNEIVVRWEK